MPFRSTHPDVPIPDLSLTGLVLRRADAFGERPAFVDGLSGSSISFGDLGDRIRAVAVGLSGGDRVRRQHSEVRIGKKSQARAGRTLGAS